MRLAESIFQLLNVPNREIPSEAASADKGLAFERLVAPKAAKVASATQRIIDFFMRYTSLS